MTTPHHLVHPTATTEIAAAIAGLEVGTFAPDQVIPALVAWGEAMAADPVLAGLTGFPFLRLWLREGSLRGVLERDFGDLAVWRQSDGRGRLGIFPVGVVGCWPAGNVDIQPFLTAACALLGGNACVLRVPKDLNEIVARGLAALAACPGAAILARRIVGLAINRDDAALHAAMAAHCDGAMIWGGHDAVTSVRALPFPPHAHLSVFGPRFSVGAVTLDAWASAATARNVAEKLARDLWPFEQQACSSPQVVYVECAPPGDDVPDAARLEDFVGHLATAFTREAALHPRRELSPSLTTAIAKARADWLMDSDAHRARFPLAPDWTILYGIGARPPVTQGGRVLTVIGVARVEAALADLTREVQTLGLACADRARESAIAEQAARRGCDRIVPFGRMHVFDTPWDGLPLVSGTTRQVRHIFHSSASQEPDR